MRRNIHLKAFRQASNFHCLPDSIPGHIPNFRIMEIDIDDVPWKDDLVTKPPLIQDGMLKIPEGIGWGTELNEEAIAAHPVKNTGDERKYDRGMG